MRRFLLFLVVIFCFGCVTSEKLYYIAPSAIPHTQRLMKTSGFWIARHPSPDERILSESEIKQFNRHVEEILLVKDMRAFPLEYSGEKLITEFKKSIEDISREGYFLPNGKMAKNIYFDAMKKQMNLDTIASSVNVQFGFVAHYTSQRILPTSEGLYAVKFDIDFDELQNSALDVGTPVAILHKSLDGEWAYVVSALTDGWVNTQDIALCDFQTFQTLQKSEDFVVVTDAKADLYLNSEMTEHYDYVRMGVKLPLLREQPRDVWAVRIPERDEKGELRSRTAYVKKESVHKNYLPYTPRNVIEQAFRLHNSPYGWGGMYGEQDCSRFLQEVFATVGIYFPRNSSAQAKIGVLQTKFEKETSDAIRLEALLKGEVLPGVCLLTLKGHIMLYLGQVDQNPYAIHATWGYRENRRGKDVVRVLNRVVVSDLSLGEDSKKGSLLKRLTGLVAIKNP